VSEEIMVIEDKDPSPNKESPKKKEQDETYIKVTIE